MFLILAALAAVVEAARVVDAARGGDVETVRRLLQEGADVNAAQGDGMTALHWAAERGDADLAQILIYAGAAVDAGTRIGRYTPLHLATRRGHLEIVERLLAAGADLEAATTNSGVRPLHLSAASGRPEVVSALLAAGADPNARAKAWGQTPLVFAAGSNRVETIRVLLAAGADPALTSYTVDAAEREQADRAADRRISELLAEFKKKENGGPDWKPTPSQVQAAIEASREVQRNWTELQKAAAEAKRKAEEEEAREEQAADAENPSGAKIYNAEGQLINVEPPPADEEQPSRPLSYGQMVGGWGGLTPLLHAVRQGHAEAAVALLEGGADIHQPSDGDRTTPLLMAAINGQFDLALMLLERGADPNLASDAGATPLFAVLERTWAPRASYSHPTEHQQQRTTYLDVMKALLEAGADPNVRLEKHLWYMEYTFGVLRQSGINMEGATPFWRAAYALDVDAMRLLKEHGADPHIPTVKPPERRRRPQASEEEEEEYEEGQEKPKAKAPGKSAKDATPPAAADEKKPVPAKANAEGESSDDQRPRGEEKEKDPSGVPAVPVGGPAIAPIHAASGVGYGQAFAGNAHRYVPDNWLAAVKFLVEECGADVNLRDHNAYTPLHHAASRGDNELIRYLVEQGGDVTVVSRKGQTTADMANGPIQRVPPYPETIALLEKLGSKNNNNCVSC